MRRVLLIILAVVVVSNAGCRRWRERQDAYLRRDMQMVPRDYIPPGTAPYGYPPTNALPPGMPGAPGAGVEANRPEILTPQPPPPNPMPNGSVMPPNASGYAPLPGSGLRPADHAQRNTEEPPLARSTPKDQKPRVLQLPPDLLERRAAENIPPTKVPDSPPSSPVGIAMFSEVKEKAIAVGQKPDLEGLDWLKANKYHTVIHLRRVGADDSADKEQVERRGMKYVSFELSPGTATKEMVDQFSKTVSEAGNQPVFVYDRDGLLVGAMFYLHLRLSDKMPDKSARDKAGLLGLQEKGSDEATALWAKIQDLLKN